MTQAFNRHQVYAVCLLATAAGVKCNAFGNACDKTNKGEYKSPFYQEIAAEYYNPALTEKECWEVYVSSEYYPNRANYLEWKKNQAAVQIFLDWILDVFENI